MSNTEPRPDTPDLTSGESQFQPDRATQSLFQRPRTSRPGSLNFDLELVLWSETGYPARHAKSHLYESGSPPTSYTSTRLRSHSASNLFVHEPVCQTLTEVSHDVCEREQYHLLDTSISPDHMRLLVSLNPEHAVSRVVKMVKGNLSRKFGRRFPRKDRGQGLATLPEARAAWISRPFKATSAARLHTTAIAGGGPKLWNTRIPASGLPLFTSITVSQS